MRARFKKNGQRQADRVTLALAASALATVGTVIGGQGIRLARRRAELNGSRPDESGTVLETAEHAIALGTQATQDTVNVVIQGYEATPRGETILLNMLSGFVGAFAVVRISTWGQRDGWWPIGTVRVRGRHIHHFVPGILLAFGTGAAAILTANERLEQILAAPFGAGIGLTFDEAALLLSLRDVYWTPEGILSVQLSLGASAIMGSTILGLRMLRRGEQRSEEFGLIPHVTDGAGI